MDSILRFAIISDLHCSHSSNEKSSTETILLSDSLRLPYREHPIEAFLNIIKTNTIVADYLICPGDITNRIDKQGLISGKYFLDEMKSALKAKELFLSVGNHDVDSYRQFSEYSSAYHILRHFTKSYPYQNETSNKSKSLNEKYWADGYYLFQNDEILLLNLNTCFEHWNDKDVKSIQILPKTLDEIESELRDLNFNGLKIALLHHHPIKISNSNIRYKDFDVVDNGDVLLDILDRNSFNLVIHGHKHIPILQERNGLPIFCAGSFSSTLNIKDVNGFNTFHILEIDKTKGLSNGIIETYFYSNQKGWFVFHDPYYFFPHLTGFGNRRNLLDLKNELKGIVGKEDYIDFNFVKNKVPEIKYLNPYQQEKLEKLLNLENLSFNPKLPLGPKYLENYGNR